MHVRESIHIVLFFESDSKKYLNADKTELTKVCLSVGRKVSGLETQKEGTLLRCSVNPSRNMYVSQLSSYKKASENLTSCTETPCEIDSIDQRYDGNSYRLALRQPKDEDRLHLRNGMQCSLYGAHLGYRKAQLSWT